ncbi:uncharacterized protein LOC121385329 [Gigantopelta aegis]|uniref:uncharacterized protein LOC121385329 n=1 Tax=Gigantopelta aegis TaxID=1735272 RepID=UPI001B88BEC6|nr:uncharacterized protein LOC121385329 [Gigantopelta aegis]
MASSFPVSGGEWISGPEVGESGGDATSTQRQPLRNTLQTVCKRLQPFSEMLEAKIKTEMINLHTSVEVNAMEVSVEIDQIGVDIIKKLTKEIFNVVNAEQERLKKNLESLLLTTKKDIDTILTKDKQLLLKTKENLKLGENLIKSGSDSDIKTSISILRKLALEISQTNRKTEIPKLKISLTNSKKKNTETFSVVIGEISKHDIKSLTDRQTLTDTQTDRLILTDTQTDRLTLTDTRTDRQTERLTLSDTWTDRLTLTQTQIFYTKISDDECDPCLESIAVLGGERSKKIVLSDYHNACVKCFSAENSKLLFKYKLPSEPVGLARSRDQQVVVTLPWKCQILYLDIEDDTPLTNTLNTEKSYGYISVLPSNRLAVTKWGSGDVCVDILDEGGHVIQSLPGDLIPNPSHLTVKGDSLVVVLERNSLKCVTSSGCVTWQSPESARLRHLGGVACDMEECVYVCDDQRNCIVQLSRDAEVFRDVITDQDELSRPRSVCCDQDKVYVTQEDGHVKIFTWNNPNP